MFVFLSNPLHPFYPLSFPDFLKQYPPNLLSYIYTHMKTYLSLIWKIPFRVLLYSSACKLSFLTSPCSLQAFKYKNFKFYLFVYQGCEVLCHSTVNLLIMQNWNTLVCIRVKYYLRLCHYRFVAVLWFSLLFVNIFFIDS